MIKSTRPGVFAMAMLLSPCWLIAANQAWAVELHVSPNGSDSNSGSAQSPLRTISAASNKLQPGDTVLLGPGEYQEPIKPVRSGTSDRPIAYRALKTDQPPRIRAKVAIIINGLSHIQLDGIAVYGSQRAPNSDVNIFADIANASYVVLNNCDFRNANGYHGVRINSSKFITVKNSTIDFVGEYQSASGSATGDNIRVDAASSRILIANNVLKHGGHNLVNHDGSESVIHGNVMDNSWRDVHGGEAGYRSAAVSGRFNVFEGNHIVRNGIGSKLPSNVLAKILGEHNIARNNVFTNAIDQAISSDSGQASPISQRARIYNNTFFNINSAAWRMRFYSNGEAVGLGVFVNNLVQRSRIDPENKSQDTDIMFAVSDAGSEPTANSRVVGNLFSPAGGAAPAILLEGFEGRIELSRAEDRYPGLINGNKFQAVSFASASPVKYSDFKPASGSAAIDAGVFLTTTVDAGSGARMPVADASYFSNGWGVTEGDTIQLEGETTRAVVRRVDYAGNTLELDRAITFRRGQGVSLPYSGRAPDIGAIELDGPSAVAPQSPTGLVVE